MKKSAASARNLFHSPQEQFVFHNYHRPMEQQTARDILISDRDDRIRLWLMLAPPGGGRGYFLHSAAHQATAVGRPVEYVPLRLDHFDPDGGSIDDNATKFLERCAERHGERGPALFDRLKLSVKARFGPFSVFDAASLEIAAEWIAQGRELLMPDEPVALTSRDRLRRVISEITRKAQVILHLPDPNALSTTFLGGLIEEHKSQPRLILALSFAPDEAPARSLGAHVQTFTFSPLTQNELRRIVERNFDPHDFPDLLFEKLFQCSGGLPGLIGAKLAELLAEKLIDWDENLRRWRLPDPTMTSDKWVECFRTGTEDALVELRAAFGAAVADRLDRFLDLAALCGTFIPVNRLIEHMGLPAEERDDFIDVLDDHFTADGSLMLWRDHGYELRESFPDELIYKLRDPLARLALLRKIDAARRGELASGLLAYLEKTLPVSSRQIARLFLELSRHFLQRERWEHYREMLGGWIGLDEADRYGDLLRRAIERGEVDVRPLLILYESFIKGVWPPYRQNAIINAIEKAGFGVPLDCLAWVCVNRAQLQATSGDFPGVLEVARKGLRAVGANVTSIRGVLEYFQCEALLNLDFNAEALDSADAAVRTFCEIASNESLILALALRANCLAAMGKREEAVGALDEALPLLDRPVRNPFTYATALYRIGLAAVDLRDFELARHFFLLAKEWAVKSRGPVHGDVGLACVELGRAEHALGNLPAAEAAFLEGLPIVEHFYGPESPVVPFRFEKYAKFLHDTGREQQAAEVEAKIERLRRPPPLLSSHGDGKQGV